MSSVGSNNRPRSRRDVARAARNKPKPVRFAPAEKDVEPGGLAPTRIRLEAFERELDKSSEQTKREPSPVPQHVVAEACSPKPSESGEEAVVEDREDVVEGEGSAGAGFGEGGDESQQPARRIRFCCASLVIR